MPNPPLSEIALPSASPANEPSGDDELSSESLPNVLFPGCIGANNSFMIAASNSWAALTSRGDGTLGSAATPLTGSGTLLP